MAHKEKKLLLRDWLEVQLDSGRGLGIEWLQKDTGLFKMVWRHANNPIWIEEDGWIYRQWAIHKSHYKPNPDGSWPEADYPTWKARFRCALKRCNDVEEMPITKTSGKDKQEWRVYRLLPKKERRAAPVFMLPTSTVVYNQQEEESTVVDLSQAALSQATTCVLTTGSYSTDLYNTVAFATQRDIEKLPANIPAVLSGYQGTPPASLATEMLQQPEATISGGLQALMTQDLFFQMPADAFEDYGKILMDVSMGNSIEIDNSGAVLEMPDSVSYMSFKNAPIDHDMCIWLRYKNTVVGKHYVQNEKGCRIYWPDQLNVPVLSDQFTGTNHVGFPAPEYHVKGQVDPLHMENTKKLLSYMDNGLHIYCDNACNIYATRLSRCRIYYADPAMNAAEPILLPRKQTVKVFDSLKFKTNFEDLQKRSGRGQRPSVCVLFSFGEQWSLTKAIDKTLISATLINAQSWHHLSKYLAMMKAHGGATAFGQKCEIEELSSDCQKMSLEQEQMHPTDAGPLG